MVWSPKCAVITQRSNRAKTANANTHSGWGPVLRRRDPSGAGPLIMNPVSSLSARWLKHILRLQTPLFLAGPENGAALDESFTAACEIKFIFFKKKKYCFHLHLGASWATVSAFENIEQQDVKATGVNFLFPTSLSTPPDQHAGARADAMFDFMCYFLFSSSSDRDSTAALPLALCVQRL